MYMFILRQLLNSVLVETGQNWIGKVPINVKEKQVMNVIFLP